MGYLHIEVNAEQEIKKPHPVCGDLWHCERNDLATTLICCDGYGSGVMARIAARMAVSKLLEFLRLGYSLHQAFSSLVGSINRIRSGGFPYAAFAVARILPDGSANVLGYDMPPPLLVMPRQVAVLQQQSRTVEQAVINEADCRLAAGDGLLLVTDGVTQSGMGLGFDGGWGPEGVRRYAEIALQRGVPLEQLPGQVVGQALVHWKGSRGDDCTAVLASCRPGRVLSILTGPPVDPRHDGRMVARFMKTDGFHVVCGASTAKMVARQLHRTMRVEQGTRSAIAPPECYIEGIDLATEGAITLNQLYNILDEDPAGFEPDSPVTRFYEQIMAADRIDFLVGGAVNVASTDISFVQNGILPRRKIVPLLADKLRTQGKLVVEEYY